MTRPWRRIFSLSLIAIGVLLAVAAVGAGELNPPGPPAPTANPAEPRTPIAELPFVISEPGSYYLVGNLTGVAASPGIVIEASHVTIDLMGFSLSGGAGSLQGIKASPPVGTLEGLVVRNGTVRRWSQEAIDLGASTGCTLENLRILINTFHGAVAGRQTAVRDCVAIGNGGYGIVVDDDSTVTGCTAQGNGTGISADSGSTVTDCTAMENSNTGFGIGGGCVVRGCTARANALGGFSLYTDTVIVDCSATENGPGAAGLVAGIAANPGVLIQSCTASANHGVGIIVTGNSQVIGNTCAFNTTVAGDGAGIQSNTFAADNRIEGNTLLNNDIGIRVLDEGNLILRNTLSGNATPESIAANNAFGPFVDISGAGDISGTMGADHPWANFEY
jgi:parallel beta-helix repeat protein